MKHPLTSKERRGLVAVAAAALLCIGSGFIFRNCTSRHAAAPSVTVIDNDSAGKDGDSDKSDRSNRSGRSDRSDKSDKPGRKSRKKAAKKKTPERVYPTREPLDQPID